MEGRFRRQRLRISRTKTEYLRYNFSGDEHHDCPDVTIGEDVVASTTKFKYLGYVIQSDGEIDGDLTHRIQAGWLKWRSATGVLCDKKFPIRLKGKFYRVIIRPALLYETECWPIKKIHKQKMEVAEIRWMCGNTIMDKIKNQEFTK